jgi:hypothetical protein
MGLALVRVASWGVGRLITYGFDRAPEIRRLSKLDEPSLLVEIAHRDNANVALDKPHLIQYGQATVDGLLPRARALICPHRNVILEAVSSPEIKVITTVADLLVPGVPIALVNPVAALLVKRGLPLLCGKSSPSATGVAR